MAETRVSNAPLETKAFDALMIFFPLLSEFSALHTERHRYLHSFTSNPKKPPFLPLVFFLQLFSSVLLISIVRISRALSCEWQHLPIISQQPLFFSRDPSYSVEVFSPLLFSFTPLQASDIHASLTLRWDCMGTLFRFSPPPQPPNLSGPPFQRHCPRHFFQWWRSPLKNETTFDSEPPPSTGLGFFFKVAPSKLSIANVPFSETFQWSFSTNARFFH